MRRRALHPSRCWSKRSLASPILAYAPAHSPQLAENIVAGLRGKEGRFTKQAAAVLADKHGIFVAGKDLLAAIDALERLDWNAWCILAQELMKVPVFVGSLGCLL
ncbi:MAG: class II aldolase/adducin family protein [Anaerolineae bacterium]